MPMQMHNPTYSNGPFLGILCKQHVKMVVTV